ncbi:HK97 gp10 family phage protein [Lysinibacillus halotolerans]
MGIIQRRYYLEDFIRLCYKLMGITRFGHKRLRKAVNRWSDEIIDDVKRIVTETAYILQTEARARAPEDSGYLRQSIEVDLMNNGLTAVVTVGADYAIYIEYGTGIYAVNGDGRKTPWVYYSDKYGEFVFTRGMKAQPFWFDAVETARKYFKKEMRKLGR